MTSSKMERCVVYKNGEGLPQGATIETGLLRKKMNIILCAFSRRDPGEPNQFVGSSDPFDKKTKTSDNRSYSYHVELMESCPK